MRSNRTQVVLLLVFLFCTAVYGAGQMFLNQINPVKDDTVTFENDVFTYDAVIENGETNTFQILKQYELNIQVPAISLTGTNGVEILGSLGASLNSQGNVAVGGADFYGEGHSISLNSLQEFDISSAEDTNFSSNLATSILAAGVNVTTTGAQGINIASAGDVTISTKDEVNIAANQLSNNNDGDLTLDALRGVLEIASGTKTTLSSGEKTHINGVLGVNLVSAGTFNVISEEAFFFGQAISNLAMGDTTFAYRNVVVAAEEDIKVYGDSVSLSSSESSIYFKASGLYSNLLLTGDSGINLQANSLVSLASQGEAGDVVILSNGFALESQSLSSTIGGNLVLGGNNTDNIQLSASGSIATFTLKGYYLDANAADEIYINATRNINLSARGNTFFQTAGGVSSGSNSLIIQSTNSDFYLYSDIGDGSVLLQAFDSNVVVDSDGDLVLDTYNYISHFTGVQQYNVGPVVINTIDDSSIRADTTADFTANNFEGDGYNVEWNAADSLSLFAANFVGFTSYAGTHFISNSSISFLSSSAQSYFSGNDLNIENVNSTLEALSNIDYQVDTFSLTSGNALFYARGEMTIELSESFHAVVTDDFTLDSNILNINVDNDFFKSSNIILASTDSALLKMNTFTGKFGYVLVDATGAATLDTDTVGDINIVSGEDITLASLGPLLLNVSSDTEAYVEEDFTVSANSINSTIGFNMQVYSNSGDQTIQTGDSLTIQIASTANWEGDDISIYADENLVVDAATSFSIFGGETTFTSGVNNQLLSITSNSSTTFITSSHPNPDVNFSITENGRALNFTASDSYEVFSQDSVSYSSASLDFDSSTLDTFSDELQYSGSTTIFNATTSGTFTSDLEARFVSGDDDYINIDSAQNLIVTSDSIDILSEGDTKFEVQNFITINADGAVEFFSEYLVTVSAADSLTLLATDSSLTVASAYSVNIDNANGFDTLIRSNEDDVIFEPARDFGIEANGIDELSECGVLLSASNRGTGDHQHISSGTLDILAEHCVDIRSFYTDQTADSTGNINIASSGHAFLFSETEAVTLLSNGVDTTTNNAINLQAASTVEIQATKSAVYIFGETGLSSDSGNNYDVHGLRGVTLKSNGTDANISFESTVNTYAVGARGLTLAAGTDAPFFAGDFTASADGDIVVESGNNILFRSFAAISGPDAIRFTASGDIDVESNEGAGVFLSSAQDVNVIGGSAVSIRGIDGLIRLDADIGDFTVESVNTIAWTTTHGPIGIEGKGSGGSITFNALSFDSTSYLSTRVDALGSGSVVAGSTLTFSSPDASACVQVQTFRDYDDVTISAADSFSLITNADPQVYDIDHVIIAGNNVDIAATDSVSFLQSELFEIGRDSTPIIRVIAGGIGATGVTVNALGDIELNSGSTYASTSTLDTTFNSQGINVTSQGVISLVAEGTVPGAADFTISSLNFFSIEADFIQEVGPVSYTVTSQDDIIIQSLGDDTGDRIEFDSLTFINAIGTGTDSGYRYSFDISAVEAGEFQVETVADVRIFNSNNIDTNTYDYYEEPLLALETEKGQIEWIAGDSSDILISSATASVQFTSIIGDINVNSGFDTTFTVGTSTTILSADAVVAKAGNDLTVSSDDISLFANPLNQYYLYNDLVPQDNLSGKVLWNSYDEIVGTIGTDIIIDAVEDVIVDSFGTLTLDVSGDLDIDIDDTTASNVLSFNSDDDIIISASNTNFNWIDEDVNYLITEEVYKNFTSGASTSITAAQITAASTNKDVIFEAQVITIDNGGDLDFTANGIYLETLGAKSDINVEIGTTVGLTYTLADFLATDLNLVKTTTTLTISDVISEYHSLFGDVSFDFVTLATFDADNDLTFDAFGRNNARISALELNSEIFTVNAEDSIFWQGYQSTDFRVLGRTSIINFGLAGNTLDSLTVESTNYGGNIEFNTFNGDFTINTASFQTESDEAFYYGAQIASFTATTGDISLTTDQDFSRITVRTLSEESQANFNADVFRIDTNRYSEYLTSDKSDFNGQIVITAPTLLKLESKRAAASVPYLDDSMIIQADEYGIWMHSANAASTVAFFSGNLFHSADRVIFTGNAAPSTSFDLSNDNFDTVIRVGNNYNINAVNFEIDLSVLSVIFETDGLDPENHIILSGPSALSLVGVSTVNLLATGSNSNIELIADETAGSQLTFTSTNVINNIAKSGIRFLTTNSLDESAISFAADVTLGVLVEDWEDSILFQSDNDIVITGDSIRELSYNHRLGFFSQEPDFINYVSTLGRETCVYVGYCGGNSANAQERNLAPFTALGTAISALQQRLMDFGLIEYHNGII